MPLLTTSALSTEVLEDALLTLEQVTTRISVLALNASRNPEQSVRVRMLLGDLLADIQDCERELGTNGASGRLSFSSLVPDRPATIAPLTLPLFLLPYPLQ